MRVLVKIFLFLSIFSLTFFLADYYFPYIVSKVFPFRLFIELATISWLINLYWFRIIRFKFSEPIVKAVLVFSGALLASTLFGVNPLFSFWSNFERSEGLFSFLHYLAFFILLIDVFSEDDYYRLIKFLLLLSPLISYYGFSSFRDANTYQYGRVFGVFGNPSYLAAFLIFVFGFGVLLILRNIEFAKVLKDPLLIVENILWIVLLLGDVPAFILTQTRGAYIGLLVGVLVFLIFLLRQGKGVQKKYAVGGLIVLLSLVALAGFVILKTKIAPANLKDPSTLVFRFATWGSAWKSFLDHPLFGYGMENFSVGFDKHYNPIHSGVEVWFDHAHSVIFDALASTGLLGLISYIAIFVVLFRFYLPVITKRRPVLEAGVFFALPIAYFVQNLVLFDTLSSYILFFLFLGVVRSVFLKETSKNKEKTFFAAHPILLSFVVVMLVIAVVFGIYANFVAYQKNRELRTAYTLSRQSQLPRGVEEYRGLLDMPGYLGRREVIKDFAAYLYEWSAKSDLRSLSKEDGGALGGGLRTVNDFLDKEDPQYLNGYYLFANTYNVIAFKLGDATVFQKTESTLKEMNTKSPNRIEIINLLADNLIAQRKYDEALSYALQITTLRPDMEVGHRLVGFVYNKIGRRDEAKKKGEEALRINPSSTAAEYLKKIR
ncbi:MAG: O-antigen ligase family protein [Parcubacteria group bacterium]|nr:O-antigen ligase family protein [Parcubacteria group bacterium]